MQNTQVALFGGKKIRKTIYKNEWWFVVEDVVLVLIDSANVKDYITKLRSRDEELNKGYGQFVRTLEVPTEGGRQKMNCATTEGVFRIIQSIPSPKAEPFKRWLAKVGYERVQEIADPELAAARSRELYRQKGYSEDWIDKRMRGMAIRQELTDEWKSRGARERTDYEILTAEISKATFGMTPAEYQQLKGLERESLRDHMNNLELIFTMLGESSTTEIHRGEDSQGLPKLASDAQAGGEIAGGAKKALEKRLKRSVVSEKNYLGKKAEGKWLKG